MHPEVIETPLSPWKGDVLPLNYGCLKEAPENFFTVAQEVFGKSETHQTLDIVWWLCQPCDCFTFRVCSSPWRTGWSDVCRNS
jgi:hypothetical protein